MEFELGLGLAMEFAFGSEARNCCVVEEVGGGDSSVEVSASSTTISRRTTGQYIETCLLRQTSRSSSVSSAGLLLT